MPSYVVFLRAVNVGKRQVKMAELRSWLEHAGFADVETYIQTGNVKVSTSLRSKTRVQQQVESVLRTQCGFDVPSMVLTCTELRQVYDDAIAIEPPRFAGSAEERRFVIFFQDAPTAASAKLCAEYDDELEQAWVIGRTAHVWIARTYQDAKIFGALEKVFAPGTTRNLKVVATLAGRWGE